MSTKTHDPELEARLADIRARIAGVDHDSFESCEAFSNAVAEAVPAEEMKLLLEHDPLIGNLCCIFMQAGEHFAMDKLSGGILNALRSERGLRTTVIEINMRRKGKKDGPKTPPTA